MAAENNYMSRFQEDFELSDQEVVERINATMYEPHSQPQSNQYNNLYAIYNRGFGAETRQQQQQKKEETLTPAQLEELKKVWDKYERVEQPADLSIKLFPHQLVSIHTMEKLERVRKVKSERNVYITDFGILGDIPGYGKSYSIVALILRDKMEWNIDKKHETANIVTYNSHLKMVTKTEKTRVRANLVLASATLISQWKEYFKSVKTPGFKLKEISSRKDLEGHFDPNDWDVVLVNTTRYNDLIDRVGQVVWKRFIFDEAASTHISSMRHVHAGFVWFVSATYMELLRLGGSYSHYMKGFFADIHPELLKLFVVKNSTHFVKHSFKMPQVHDVKHLCLNPRVLNVLSNFIDTEARTMISAGNIRGAIDRIGGGLAEESNLFEIVSRKQKEKLAQAKFSLDFWKNRPNSQRDVEMWEKRVKEIEKTIVELEEKYKTILEEDCSICFGEIENPVLLPCCQNIFCGNCIIRWMEDKRNCPMCRSKLSGKDLVYIKKDDEKEDKEEEKKESKSK